MYISKTFTNAKKSVLCAEYSSNELKNPFIQMENIFFQFLKIELWGGLGYSRKNPNSGGRGKGEDMELPRYQINGMCNFRGLIKNEVKFPRVTKKK